jgi:hypothetical protein
MAKNITPVPNGPLIKKKGPYAGSTLRSGGTIKKAQNGDTLSVKKPTWQQMTQAQRAAIKTELGPEKFKTYKDSVSTDATNRREAILNRNAAARGMTRAEVQAEQKKSKNKYIQQEGTCDPNFSSTKCGVSKAAAKESKSDWKKKKNGGPIKKAQNGTSQYSDPKPLYDKIKRTKDSIDNAKIKLEEKKYKTKMTYLNGKLKNEQSMMNTKKVKKAKAGAMIKRADGSMSRRGLWDNIRANKGSGKKPTKQMLQQEKKIKAKTKK